MEPYELTNELAYVTSIPPEFYIADGRERVGESKSLLKVLCKYNTHGLMLDKLENN